MVTRRKAPALTHDHPERIAILETKVEAMSRELASIDGKLDTITSALSRNKGFWGAVLIVTSALWAAITQFGHLFTRGPGT